MKNTEDLKWTSTIPSEDGFYWHRDSPRCEPEVVELYEGDMYKMGMDTYVSPKGQFWPEKLNHPVQ